MNHHIVLLRQPLLLLGLGLLLGGCAGGAAGSGFEPYDPLKDVASSDKYRGEFLPPLFEDWEWAMPDTGHWVLSRMELSQPFVDGDRVFVGSSRAPGLFVLERETGRVLRDLKTSGPVQAQPVPLSDGWLVADTFGELQRLDKAFQPVWAAPFQAGAAIYRAPLVLDDLVIITTGSDQVFAVDLATGSTAWSFRREVPRGALELAILGAPEAILAGEHVVVGFSDGSISGLDPKLGVERWREQVGEGKFPDIQAEPVVVENQLIVAAFGGPLVAFDLRSRARNWTNENVGATSRIVEARGTLYMTAVQGELIAVDAASGKQKWSWSLGDAQLGTPIVHGGVILVGAVGGSLHAIDRFEGKALWSYEPEDGRRVSGITAAPTIAGRQALFTSAGGRLVSLSADRFETYDPDEFPAKRPSRTLGW